MRCDDNPEGCSPCMQNQSACKTTDRITGRATVRGHVQNLERRLQQLESHCHELEDRLTSLGADVKTSSQYGHQVNTPQLFYKEAREQGFRPDWPDNAHAPHNGTRYSPETSRRISQTECSVSRLPDFRNGLTGENYLGVSSGNSLVSCIRGTSLNVLGMEIDLADYMHADLDEPDPSDYEKKPIYNKSYYAFILTAFSAKPKPQEIGLPPRAEGMKCVDLFFKIVNSYLPVLHKPSFMKLVSKPCVGDTRLWELNSHRSIECMMIHHLSLRQLRKSRSTVCLRSCYGNSSYETGSTLWNRRISTDDPTCIITMRWVSSVN